MNAIVPQNGITKKIKIGGIDVPMKASGSSPRIYRQVFHKDLFVELEAVKKANEAGEPYDLEFIENMAYLFAYQANPEVPDIDEWLDQFGMADVLTAAEDIMSFWNENEETKSTAKKATAR